MCRETGRCHLYVIFLSSNAPEKGIEPWLLPTVSVSTLKPACAECAPTNFRVV
jgi:hypothetical protein